MQTTDWRHVVQCDRCPKRIVRFTETGEGEGVLPSGWAELTLRVWPTEAIRGNEELFADLCPKCVKQIGIVFNDGTKG